MSRLDFSKRQGPQDFDDTAPTETPLDFDYTHAGGATPWPEKHGSIKFGPALIRRAWAGGLIVYAEIEDWPHPVAVREAQWTAGCLEVKTTAGPRIPSRLFTRSTVKGLRSTGELVE